MEIKEVKKRIEKLHSEIARLRYAYHVENDPNVTDDIYESLIRELHDLEKKYPEFILEDSDIDRVAGKPLDNFKKVQHSSRMLSLNDAFSTDEVSDWEVKIKKLTNKSFNYFAELKLDGLAVSLIYEKGIFIRGATRGDGYTGEDITLNLKMIKSIPLKLKGNFVDNIEIRGEVVMPKKVLINLNKKQEKEGKALFANTRNAAAGSLRQLDPSIVKERNLSFFAWDAIVDEKISKKYFIYKHSHKHEFLRSLGLTLTTYEKRSKSLANIFKFIEDVNVVRSNLPFGTDGIVVTVDDLDVQNSLGVVGKAPRYSVAYKYAAERATTTLIDITLHVGRTGVLTPLAHFVPVLVAGSMVSKATLHNIEQIQRLDIRIGDTVVIMKAGDVIPAVVEVLTNLRPENSKKFTMPKKCPVCKSTVEQKENFKENSVAFYCMNDNCKAKNARSLEHFVKVFEIDEIGPKILERLNDEELINDASDLFLLKESDLSGLDRFGDKSAKNIIDSISKHKKVSLWRFIYSLGIIHVGEQTAKDLSNYFDTFDKIINAKKDDIDSIENIGPVVSKSIFNFLSKKENLIFINKLFKNGVEIIKNKNNSSKLSGQTFVITGTLGSMSREQIRNEIEENGGKVSSSVSTKTSFIIVGDNPGSKYKDAVKLKVKVLTEKEFIALF